MSSMTNVDLDDILKDIAKALYRNSDINDLGKALGFEPADISRKIEENAKQGGNYMGTLDLLRMWRKRQTPSTEKAALRSVLLKAGFDNLTDQYLSTPVPAWIPFTMAERLKTEEMTEPQSDDTPSTRMRSSVANGDFDDILEDTAKALYRNSEINDLGKALGFGPTDIGRTIEKNHHQGGNYMGTLDLLRMWRNRQTPSTEKAALRSALLKSGLDNRADQYLGTPVPVPAYTDAVIQEAIRKGEAPWNRSRIMVIGPAGVGKTSLIRRLTGQKFDPEEKSTKGAEQNVVTKSAVSSWTLVNDIQTAKDDIIKSIAMDPNFGSNGRNLETPSTSSQRPMIKGSNRSTLGKKGMTTSDNEKIAKISQGITREEITKVKSSALDITYSMWDFGGQEIYYITHPLFLSWRSLYILVIPLHLELSDTAPREEDALKQLKGSALRTHRTILDLVHFWLMSIYTHAVTVQDSNLDPTYEPKVLLIGTFAGDDGPRINEEKVTAKFQELKDRLGSNPYWKQVLSPMCGIDNQFSPRSEVNKIQDRIDGLIKDSAYMKLLMPTKWRTFLTEIEDSDQNTLKVTQAHSTMKTWGIDNLKEVEAVLKFYHDIGHLIYHQGCELIVLKPQFLNSIVSNIITVIDEKKMEGELAKYWKDLVEKGILSIEVIQAIWKEHKGDHDQLDNIIDMMIKFDLICEIPDRPDERQFFVPCRSSPKLDEREKHGKDDKVKFTIDFHHFLPDGFLHRFYVRMAKWSMERMKSNKPIFHCRQMMFYIDNRHRVVMTNEIHSKERHQIEVMIYAVTPANAPSGRTKARVSLNENIIDHLHDTLEDLKKRWARRIEYSVGILCPNCSEHGSKELIPIRKILKDQDVDGLASCNISCPVYVGDILKAFNKGTQLPSEKQGDSSVGVHVDAADLSRITGNTFIGQQNITKSSRYSHGSEDDSLDEPPTKRAKKTNRQTPSP